MLYYLFTYLENQFEFPGATLFQFITFRAGFAIILSLIISMLLGKRIVNMLRRMQVGESVRDLGLEGQKEKEGTPTMGGLLILAAVLIPTLLFAKLENIYILLMLLVTVWMGFVGFLDDYIKVFKKDKRGLAGKFKIIGQVTLGIIIGATLYFHPDVKVAEEVSISTGTSFVELMNDPEVYSMEGSFYRNTRNQTTTIPFFKSNELDYVNVLWFLGDQAKDWAWIIFIPIVIFIVTAVSNGVNMTDGIDGLATGTSAIVGLTLGIFAYVSGNIILSDYLNIMFIPNSGELVIYVGAFIGACIGFLWYNAFPAQVFMGDTGSLAIGGIIAALAIIVRKELLLPILCGVFLAENLSVMLQVGWFKFTKKKYGAGRRIFKMAPLHHHYQKLGMHESKIVSRFWIVGIMLAVFTLVTLKIR